MATRDDSEGFVSTPREEKWVVIKTASDENASELKETDAEFKRLKADFIQIARNRRQRSFFKGRTLKEPIAHPTSATAAINKSPKAQNCHILLNRRGVVVEPNQNTIRFASDHERCREIQINLCCAFW